MVQARVASVGQILFGYYKLPSHVEQPIDFSLNPIGDAWRSEPRQVPAVVLHVMHLPALGQPCPNACVCLIMLSDAAPVVHSCKPMKRAFCTCVMPDHNQSGKHVACRAWSEDGDMNQLLILAPKGRFSLQEAVIREASDMPPTEAAAHILVNAQQWDGQVKANVQTVMKAAMNVDGMYVNSASSLSSWDL